MCLGLPTYVGKNVDGISSPAKPALIMPDPLSRQIGTLKLSIYLFIMFEIEGLEELTLRRVAQQVGKLERARCTGRN